MYRFLLRVTFLFSVLLGSVSLSRSAGTLATSSNKDSVIVFKFMARNDTFWASYKGNEREFARLASFIHNNRQLIMSKNMPVLVNGYCSSFDDFETNKRIVKLRSNHVKTFVIVNYGLSEDNFKTLNYTTPLNGQTDIVTMTFRVKASDVTKLAKPIMPAEVEVKEDVRLAILTPSQADSVTSANKSDKWIKGDILVVDTIDIFAAPKKAARNSIFVAPPSLIPQIKVPFHKSMSADAQEASKPPTNKVAPASFNSNLPAPNVSFENVGRTYSKPIKVKKEKTSKSSAVKEEKPNKKKTGKKEKSEKPVKVEQTKDAKPVNVKETKVKKEKPVKEDHSLVNKPVEFEISSVEITSKLKETNRGVVEKEVVQEKPIKAEKSKPVKVEKAKPVKAEKSKPVKVEKAKPVKAPKPSIGVKPNSAVEFELKTNLLYWLTTTANIEGEILYKQKLGLNLEYQFAHTDFDNGALRLRMSSFSPELRFYPIAGRLFVGAYYGTGLYNYKFSTFGYQGAYNGGGISIGYKLPVTKSIGFEFSLSGGYAWTVFDKYTTEDGCNRYNMSNSLNYFGPTKAKVSFVWRIGGGKR